MPNFIKHILVENLCLKLRDSVEMQNFGYFMITLLIGLDTEQSVSIYCMDTDHLPGKTQKECRYCPVHENWLPKNLLQFFVCMWYMCVIWCMCICTHM